MSSGDRSNAKGKINLKRKEIASRTHIRGVAGKTQIEAKKSENLKRNLRKTTWLWRITRKIAGEGSRKQTPTTRERERGFFSLLQVVVYTTWKRRNLVIVRIRLRIVQVLRPLETHIKSEPAHLVNQIGPGWACYRSYLDFLITFLSELVTQLNELLI